MPDASTAALSAAIDAFNHRDLEGMLERIHPDVELIPLRALMEGGGYRGHEGVRRWVRDAEDEIEGMLVRTDELRGTGDVVVVLGAIHGRLRASGIELDMPAAWLVRLEAGKVRYLRAYSDPSEALADAGLPAATP
jgi:uncharacterized protein